MNLFDAKPLVIAALHLPDFAANRATGMAEMEDYTLKNLAVFAAAGVPAVKIQDQTKAAAAASPETIAMMSALVRLARHEFPQIALGVIVQAHDALAPLAVAHAAGACFVRLKVFAGAAIAAEGAREALGPAARSYRLALGRPDIAILADVHDRTAVPLGEQRLEQAAQWAQGLGADGLILTGGSFADSCARVRAVRAAGVKRKLLIGGGVDESNVGAALQEADGVIVSTALLRDQPGPVKWDAEKTRRFMDRARAAA
jgi:hypothetical protein